MISLHLLTIYISALAIVYALPGPDMALVLQTSTAYGLQQGLATAGGLAMARCVHVTLSACGVAALLHNAPWLYECVRVVGGIYLAYIAIQIFRSPHFGLGDVAGKQQHQQRLRVAFGKGMLSSLFNPKALLFCSILLPQFIRPVAGPVWSQVLELGIVLVAIGLLFDLSLAIGAARISTWLRHHPRAQTAQRWTFSAALFGFALRLALD